MRHKNPVKKYYYLLTLISVFLIPTGIAAMMFRDHIALSSLIPFVLLVTAIGSVWDIWATRHGKRDRVWLWQFHDSQTLGIKFLVLPFEEYLFYVSSSLYVIYMWEAMKLMVAGAQASVYWLVLALTLWAVVCICLPYIFRSRGDRIIG